MSDGDLLKVVMFSFCLASGNQEGKGRHVVALFPLHSLCLRLLLAIPYRVMYIIFFIRLAFYI